MKPRRTAIVWLPGDEGMIDAALLPGTIAAAVYPHPPRDADWPASDGFMLKRLKCERSITAALRRKLGSAIDSEDFKLTQGEARTFLSELGCALGNAYEITSRFDCALGHATCLLGCSENSKGNAAWAITGKT